MLNDVSIKILHNTTTTTPTTNIKNKLSSNLMRLNDYFWHTLKTPIFSGRGLLLFLSA